MDHVRKEDFEQKLIFTLQKILELNNVDNTFLDKFLRSIDDELRTRESVNTHIVCDWVVETVDNWKKTQISLHESEFMCKFIELLSKHNEVFCMLQSRNFLDDFVSLLGKSALKHATVKITFIKMLSRILDHNLGCDWMNSSQAWKTVVDVYCSNVNLYVEREVVKFFEKLISIAKTKENNEDILRHVFLPIQENFQNAKDKNPNVLLFLKLLEIILKFNVFSENNSVGFKMESIDVESFLKNVVENSEQEIIVEAALKSQVLFLVLQYEDKKELLSTEDIPALWDVFDNLAGQNKFSCIVKLAKYCQMVWNNLRIQMHYENTIGLNFILIQLIPSLMYINAPIRDGRYDLLKKTLFNQKSSKSQKFFNNLEKAIKNSISSNTEDLAAKSILSVMGNLCSFNHKESALTLQAAVFTAESLISQSGYDLEATGRKYRKLGSRGIKAKSLLSALLSSVSLLLEKFVTNWTDVEELGLFKITMCLLTIPELPSSVVVQTLVVIKAAIVNCILPNPISSIHCILESFASVIYELMTNSSWEVRDSCIELVIAISELSESKYPAFEQVLADKNFQFLLLNIVENDSESYVRATAIRALTFMTKSELLNPFINDVESCLKITKLVQTESEGIVRREAALLIKEIYIALNDEHSELINLFYRVMGGAALNDLYWEVKINCLVFWETVIQRVFADLIPGNPEGCYNGSNRDQVGLRKLSKIGCLHVLLTILKEDCDMIVIEKSVEVLCNLLNILKRHNVIDNSINRGYRKRKNSGLEYEKHKVPVMTDGDDGVEKVSASSARSEKIIDEIVNDTDINLLNKVCCRNGDVDARLESVFLKEIEPETFLLQMDGFDKDRFLENKQKSFLNVEIDLTVTMSRINIERSVNEINVMDCY